MLWLNQIIFWIPLLVTAAVLLWLFREDALTGTLPIVKAKRAIKIVAAVIFIQYLARIGLFYWSLKKDPLGKYLAPGQGTNYFAQNIWSITQPLLLAFFIALVLVLIVILIMRFSKRPLFEEVDPYIIFLTSFIVGFTGIFILLVASFLLMIIWQIARAKVRKTPLNQFRQRLSPFLLLVALAQLILANFAFYQNFLIHLHLI